MKNEYNHIQMVNGIHACISNVIDGGLALRVYGWHPEREKFHKGDLVLFQMPNGQESRYEITGIELCNDPRDMYFMDCKFCPRIG